MTDITNIIEVVVYCLAAIISVIIIPLATKKLGAIQVDKDSTALDITQKWLEIAVEAAEEAARIGLIDKSTKFIYAVNILERQGITFDVKTTEALVNSAVWRLFNQFKEEAENAEASDE